MEEISKAIQAAFAEFKKEHGEDAKLEDGETFVTIFNNCILITSLEDGNLKTEFVGGQPYKVDMSLSIYGGEKTDGK